MTEIPDPEDTPAYGGESSTDDDDQLTLEDTLGDGDARPGVEDELDRGYAPPDDWSAAEGYGNTPYEEAVGEPLDMKLAEEEPEPDPYAEAERSADAEEVDDPLLDRSGTGPDGGWEVGDERAGRLVSPDLGTETDREKDLVADDVGIDGAAAGAEEAAVHVVADGDPDDLDV